MPGRILPLPAITRLLMRLAIKAMIFRSLVISGHSLTSFARNLMKMENLLPFQVYEWSGNTGLGGDRNIYFPNEGRTIRRSSHALVSDHSDIDTDCNSAEELFARLLPNMARMMWFVFAHCGGRYADIELAHDGRFEKAMEIHSSWGSFEWLVQDAFRLGYRVGIVANSDGHKGRPGASYPGAALFGAGWRT